MPTWRLGYCTTIRRCAVSDEHHDRDDQHDAHDQGDDEQRREGTGAAEFERLHHGVGQRRNDTGKDDQRYAVTDAARGDLLAQPHQEERAADQGDGRDETEKDTRIDHHGSGRGHLALEADRNTVGLEGRQDHRAVARVLVDLLAAGLALLLQRLERRYDRREDLHDDGGRDVRHDAERQHRHAADRAAGEDIEEAGDAAGVLAENLRQRMRIDAGNRNIGADTEDNERSHGEP